jgi:hypothetical protein
MLVPPISLYLDCGLAICIYNNVDSLSLKTLCQLCNKQFSSTIVYWRNRNKRWRYQGDSHT